MYNSVYNMSMTKKIQSTPSSLKWQSAKKKLDFNSATQYYKVEGI